MNTRRYYVGLVLLLAIACTSFAARRQQRKTIGLPLYTIESEHFKINYHEGVEHVARRVGRILEELYDVYTKTYGIVLPAKTEVLVSSDEENFDNFASANTNLISISANDFGYNLRGSGNYMRDVVAHEFAHIVSISIAHKAPAWMPFIQLGYFSHPNNMDDDGSGQRVEAFHILPFENLPPWFFEGIAQYESTRMGGDRWDTHRDMILRTLTLSDRLLSWDHMSVFTGKSDDFEKTYNHGFALVRYITEKYGHSSVVAILRESAKFPRLVFDRSIRKVLGISARQLYRDWKDWLEVRYRKQVDSIGEQVFGRRISKYGFDNRWPRFALNDSLVVFLTSWKGDYSWNKLKLYQYLLYDTLEEDERTKPIGGGPQGYYDIHDSLNLIVYSTMASPRSNLPFRQGGKRLRDLTIDTLIPVLGDEKPSRPSREFRKKHKHPITVRQSLFSGAFSPTGNRLAAAQHRYDRFYLAILDTTGDDLRIVYPTDTSDTTNPVQTIYTVDWSADGHRIAFSYTRHSGDRKIGIYDTLEHSFHTVCDTEHDERDPRFSADGAYLYFSSDRTGIFNIYRYELATGTLERVTNVAGGAFGPDISEDGTMLTYVNYDEKGYGVYLIDSIHVIERIEASASPAPATEVTEAEDNRTAFTSPERYVRFPRQFLLVPTLFGEEAVTERDDEFQGAPTLKMGAVMNLLDPFAWVGRGTEIGAYFLIDPTDIASLFDNKNLIIDFAGVDYDLALFGSSQILPLNIGIQYLHRGIAGEEPILIQFGSQEYWDVIEYTLTPRQLDIYTWYGLGRWTNLPIKAHLLASYVWYSIMYSLPETNISPKDEPARGYRLGTYLTYVKKKTDMRFGISPRGRALKLAYDFHDYELQDEEVYVSGNIPELRKNRYQYHQFTGSGKLGTRLPWSKKQRLYFDGWGTAVKLSNTARERLIDKGRDGRLTSFYEPVTWLPGYTYYFRDTLTTSTSQDSIVDSILISGNALVDIRASYRFPLWPRSIDLKLGFIYFDHLYGAINGAAAAAWHQPSNALEFKRSDWLTSLGLEVRLDAIWFNRYPFALSMRWDRGLDKPAPIGGNRYTLSIGFNFEDWSLLDYPDYNKTPAAQGFNLRPHIH